MTNEERIDEDKVNEFALEALAILAKVIHALERGSELQKQVIELVSKGMYTPLRVKK